MKKSILFLLVVSCIFINRTYCQKPKINLSAIKNWEEAWTSNLTRDGKYGFYQVGSHSSSKLVVKSINDSWEITLHGARAPFITSNNKYLIAQDKNDSLIFFQFTKRSITKRFAGSQMKAIGPSGEQHIFWYQKMAPGILNLNVWSEKSETLTVYSKVISYCSNQSGTRIAMVKEVQPSSFIIDLIDLNSGNSNLIWKGDQMPFGLIVDPLGQNVAFFINRERKAVSPTGLIIASTNKIAKEIRNDSFKDFVISSDLMEFSHTGKFLIFSVSEITKPDNRTSAGVAVNIWNHKDAWLPLNNKYGIDKKMLFDVDKQEIIDLVKDYDERLDVNTIDELHNNVIVYKGTQLPNELQLDQREDPKRKIILRSFGNSEDILIANTGYYSNISISPQRRYITYFNRTNRRFYSYDLVLARTTMISHGIPNPELLVQDETATSPVSSPVGDCGWLADDEGLLVCDQYDIWLFDPQGQLPPQCITANYGKKNNIQFSILQPDNIETRIPFRKNEIIFIKGISKTTYAEGFTKIKIRKNSLADLKIDLKKFHYYWVKKFDRNYLVARSDGTSPFNWFISNDLRNFVAFSDIQPQKNWNWYSKQLVNYQMPDGKWNKGVLYKPEDFDSTKRYPIIFHMYEILSDKIFMYSAPRLAVGSVVPSWMCSQGYLIFEPDIQFKFGEPGQCAYDAVVSAATYLARFPWVDSTRMGLSGASHGAYSVCYLTTRTNMFAAAAPSEGMVDEISGYNTIRDGASRQYLAESSQERMGGTMWEKPDIYIKNSPIFAADKVTTPMLIMHNREDAQVPWSQGLAWYLGLRRLGKAVWMLEYDGEGHGVQSETNRIDFTKRLDQFFAYYLKGENPPFWMTKGVRELNKQREKEFDLDKASIP